MRWNKRIKEKTMPKYPEGKLNDKDEGELSFVIGEENGKVVLHFGKPILWVGMPPEMAMDLASSLIKHARNIGVTKPITIDI